VPICWRQPPGSQKKGSVFAEFVIRGPQQHIADDANSSVANRFVVSNRLMTLPVSMISQPRVSRSTTMVVILASQNASGYKRIARSSLIEGEMTM
jgi:hypothetical protein